jgi:hypothetical protein
MPNPNAKAATRATLTELVNQFLASGQTVVVCPADTAKPKTFGRKGAIGYRGARANNLMAKGLAKAR